MGTRLGSAGLGMALLRADSLGEKGGLRSSGAAMVFALSMVAMCLFDGDLSAGTRRITIGMAWVSALFSGVKLLACCVPRRVDPPLLSDAELPRYTVIVPLFHEAHMVSGLITALSKTDYPADKLDIILACEAVDPDTVATARALVRAPFRVLVVPPGSPQTKPRALNYALERSHSELVTIYDAEDRPHPAQLRTAASAFAAHPDWTALQAPLDYFNTKDSLLAAQFGLEYAALFHVLLPFYDRLGLPFPLGGTSNHMRRSALESVEGWDPYNVTEDADLAFRLSSRSQRIGWISPPTQEEAVAQMRPWYLQRSRWLKGYWQTWRVHMHAPLSGGWRRVVMLQATLGLSLLAIAFYAPVMLALGVIGLADHAGWVEAGLPAVYQALLVFSLFCGMSVGVVGALRSGRPHLLWHVPLMPIYWLALFPPLIQGLSEMRTRPFHWHKTVHGVTGAPPKRDTIEETALHGPVR